MNSEELLFFDKMPDLLPVYETLREELKRAYPELEIEVSKTQISFRSRYIFAMASLPWRRVKGWPERYLLVSFGLSAQRLSPRIRQSVEAYPNRWTHHVPVERAEEIDGELLGWLDEAYRFARMK